MYLGDIPVNTVMAGFPSQLCLTLIGVTLLFALAQTNGTLERITDHAVRLCRGNCGTIPIMFFGLGAAFSSAGPGNIATGALLAPMAMATAVRTGIPLFLMAIMVGNGANSGALSPFAPTGIIVNGLMARNGLPGLEWRTFIYNFARAVLVAFSGYALFGGLKLFSAGRADADEVLDGRPTTFQRRHWITWASFVRHPRRHLRQGERRNVRVSRRGDPGAVGIGRRRGGVQADAVAGDRDGVRGHCADSARRAHTGHRSARVARHSHLFCTNRHGGHRFSHGIVSVYSSTSGVVLPAFLPLVPGLVTQLPGASAVGIAAAMNVGGHLVDVSPLSTLGALCLAAAPSEESRALFNRLLAWGLSMAVVGAILCYLIF